MSNCVHDWRMVDITAIGGLPVPNDGKLRYFGLWYCTKCRFVEPTTELTAQSR